MTVGGIGRSFALTAANRLQHRTLLVRGQQGRINRLAGRVLLRQQLIVDLQYRTMQRALGLHGQAAFLIEQPDIGRACRYVAGQTVKRIVVVTAKECLMDGHDRASL
ncbi:hypothetical protein PS3A_34440 [Pseudomonas sp. 3A(2025)]